MTELAICFLIILVLAALLLKIQGKLSEYREKYSTIINVEEEAEKVRKQRQTENDSLLREMEDTRLSLAKLGKQYTDARNLYDRLKSEVSMLEENLESISFGVYRPHYSFDDPGGYKAELDGIYERRKKLIKEERAVICPTDWTVNGSLNEGRKMIKQQSKLILRAFNGEVDAAVAKVTWNNVTRMEERILKVFDSVNALGSVCGVSITKHYLDLALAELRLSFEYEQKKQEIKEEQRRIREQMREEELAQREFERAKKAAEAEEARWQKALQEAQTQLEKAKASEMEAIQSKIANLEARLSEAHSKLERAVSMAQLTKSGYVYVISNIGSFGERMFKIGLTRRLDPTERVDELGDASVPFPFDIHAMIYSSDAPSLENAFHREFHDKRVNKVNLRKEFFEVSLDELETFAKKHDAKIEFTKLAEAREFRQSLAAIEAAASLEVHLVSAKEDVYEAFPDSLNTELEPA